jgi:inositol phosphorylceramide mannosyltransferase catalytic subunit
MIPKIIHQIHLGGHPLPEQETKWRETWAQYNPEWEMILWDDDKISNELHVSNPDILKKCKSFSEKSDILRFELLYQHGGLYIDTDFECLKPIDPIIDGKELVVYNESGGVTCGAFFASTKGNAHVKSLIDNLPSREQSHGHLDAAAKYGPKYLSDMLPRHLKIPIKYRKQVYPYMWNEKHRHDEDFRTTTPEAYAIHHWAHSWRQSQLCLRKKS